MAEKPKTEQPETGKDAAKPKGKKPLIIGIIVAVLAAAGGGWFVMGRKPDPAKAAAEAQKKEEKAKIFLPLDPFVVNLAGEEDRYAQIGVVLEIRNNESSESIKAMMPVVRNRVLMLISAGGAAELRSVEGKEKLAQQIAEASGRAIGWKPPKQRGKKKARVMDGDDAPESSKTVADAKARNGKSAAAAQAPAPEDDEDEAVERGTPNPIRGVHFSQFIVQ